MPSRRTEIPETPEAKLEIAGKRLKLTNLNKIYFPERGFTKRDLLQYYADISPYLLPHIVSRAMVMKRYPHGIHGKFFFMKRAPSPRPDWINTCTIMHRRAGPVDYPLVEDLAGLLWMVNLGCIDLNPWYAACGDFNRPDFLHFDLDPGTGAGFIKARQAALLVREHLEKLGMKPQAKTSGSSGIHVYVPIVHEHVQKAVWHVAKKISVDLAKKHPGLLTSEYLIENRPRGRVLVDYNQNAWGKTLASVYSVRPTRDATVSAPVSWQELEDGIDMRELDLRAMPGRAAKLGDLWKPMIGRKRFDLTELILKWAPKKLWPEQESPRKAA